MIHHPPTNALPRILVGEGEAQRLTALATTAVMTNRTPEVARTLQAEMERADVVSDQAIPADVVRMHSWVEFELDGGERRRAQIVFPGEANIDEGRISILTPIATALIGLSPGGMMMLRGNDGRPHKLRVISVSAPVDAA
jgi:regulator of nucleoside diphosphate kinase